MEAVLVAVWDVLLRLWIAVLFAETKVDKQHPVAMLALAEQEVAGLQIAVYDVLRVDVFEVLYLHLV